VIGYHDRSNFTYITGDCYDELNTEVISIMCYENSGMTTFYNNCGDIRNECISSCNDLSMVPDDGVTFHRNLLDQKSFNFDFT
jgi:hypothetical protein